MKSLLNVVLLLCVLLLLYVCYLSVTQALPSDQAGRQPLSVEQGEEAQQELHGKPENEIQRYE